MPTKQSNPKTTWLLLRESIWGLEDKLKILIESFTDQETEIKKIKKEQLTLSKKLNQITPRQHGRKR